jgi:hypothetical protein
MSIVGINGVYAPDQKIKTGDKGNDYNIDDYNDGIHIINIPTASLNKRGLLSPTDYAIFSAGSTGAYTPSTPANWSPIPTTYSEALNQLADKVKNKYESRSGVVNIGLTGNTFLTMDTALLPGVVNLPPSAGTGLFMYVIKDLGNASVNNITINAVGGDYIDTPGSFNRVINTNSGFISFFNIGIGWIIWSKG